MSLKSTEVPNPLLEQVEEGRNKPLASTVASSRAESTGQWTISNNKEQSLAWAVRASWAVNWFLLIGKAVVVVLSNSKAMTAALVDSAVDLLSQFILSTAEKYMSKHSEKYPVGRSRLEALSVIGCAFIMTMASIEVIQFSVQDMVSGLTGDLPRLEVGVVLYTITGVGILLKFLLWIWCTVLNRTAQSDMLEALAEDHLNDVLSNSVAMGTVLVAYYTPLWWFDPVGAVVISLVIIMRWVFIMSDQVKKIVGHTAPPEFIAEIEKVATSHDDRIVVDCTRVYYFGARYNVEMEIVLPGEMTVMESHDIALELQHKIEAFEDVERAFVHVDHQKRDGLEHKIERQLVQRNTSPSPTAIDRGELGEPEAIPEEYYENM